MCFLHNKRPSNFKDEIAPLCFPSSVRLITMWITEHEKYVSWYNQKHTYYVLFDRPVMMYPCLSSPHKCNTWYPERKIIQIKMCTKKVLSHEPKYTWKWMKSDLFFTHTNTLRDSSSDTIKWNQQKEEEKNNSIIKIILEPVALLQIIKSLVFDVLSHKRSLWHTWTEWIWELAGCS